ncbi:MAG: SGNH/GDSL hydrolase family protein [Clostridiales bacterium]|nr:SGNH/GDSL hydrolase family protein [Clostridiales bacterium]
MTTKKIMFTGDSITDCSRGRPVGESSTLGDSYVSNIYVQMLADDPECTVHFYNSATSGDTSRQLRARWESEVLAYPSDYIFIMIGVNDCWREFDKFTGREYAPTVDEYKENIEYMINTAKKNGSKVVLVSPYFLDLNKDDKMRAKCDRCNDALKELAKKYSLDYIDVQAAMDEYIAKAPSSYVISQDRVHPKAIGKQIIANVISQSPVWKKIIAK